MNALDWIGQIADWIGRFIPRWEIVETTHGAVKFVKGARVVALGPGVHWFWPITTEFVSYPVARQAVNLRSQTLCSTDNKSIVVGGMVAYEITDIEAIVARTYEPDDTIREIALSAIHDVCCQKSWSELQAAERSGALNRELRREVAKELDQFGVKVLKARLTDLALCRVIKLMTSVSKDGE